MMGLSKLFGSEKSTVLNEKNMRPSIALKGTPLLYSDGSSGTVPDFLGKHLLIVNIASQCGFTAQLGELQKLYDKHRDRLEIWAFPSNDFGNQEPLGDTAVGTFCQKNYGVEFPVQAKGSVKKGPRQLPVFDWLSDPRKNGWCAKAPNWNFCKYLIRNDGSLSGFYPSVVSPLGTALTNELYNS